MRRTVLAVFLTLAAVLPTTPSGAAPGQVYHERFHGSFASAGWFRSSARFSTDTFIDVTETKQQGQELFLLQFIEYFDASGDFTGATTIYAYATSGFVFEIDSARFSGASTSGSNLPAKRCSYDENFRVIGCTRVTFGVEVTWTGHGPIGRVKFHDHTEDGGIKYRFRWMGHQREANARATSKGLEPFGKFESASMGKASSGSVTVCTGSRC